MSLEFLKRTLMSSFSGSTEQEAPPVANKVNHAWLDALVEHPPTPDEPTKEFKDYFACLEEAVRARQHVNISPAGRVRPSSPQYQLDDQEAAEKAEAIFRSVFEHEGWKEQGRQAMDAAWKSVPYSLLKMTFSTEDNPMFTPAVIYKTAQSHVSSTVPKHTAALFNLADYRGGPTPPDDGGASALVAEMN